MGLKIAIQGIKGSNHHQVALNYFGDDIDLVECMSFHTLVDQLLNKQADKGVMAIENSIAGSIIPNYALVYHNNLHIIGEYYLNIHHNLMVLGGQQLSDIKEVRSHPMALLQCREYLKSQPHIKMVEDVDTAETAKRIQENQLKGIAAIAPAVAAWVSGGSWGPTSTRGWTTASPPGLSSTSQWTWTAFRPPWRSTSSLIARSHATSLCAIR